MNLVKRLDVAFGPTKGASPWIYVLIGAVVVVVVVAAVVLIRRSKNKSEK